VKESEKYGLDNWQFSGEMKVCDFDNEYIWIKCSGYRRRKIRLSHIKGDITKDRQYKEWYKKELQEKIRKVVTDYIERHPITLFDEELPAHLN
jgi:hypothetical protein